MVYRIGSSAINVAERVEVIANAFGCIDDENAPVTSTGGVSMS